MMIGHGSASYYGAIQPSLKFGGAHLWVGLSSGNGLGIPIFAVVVGGGLSDASLAIFAEILG